MNLVLHSRVRGRHTCGSIGNIVLCIYRSVILHRGGNDSNIETSHILNKETERVQAYMFELGGGGRQEREHIHCRARGRGFVVRFPPMDTLQELSEGGG